MDNELGDLIRRDEGRLPPTQVGRVSDLNACELLWEGEALVDHFSGTLLEVGDYDLVALLDWLDEAGDRVLVGPSPTDNLYSRTKGLAECVSLDVEGVGHVGGLLHDFLELVELLV